MREAVQSTPATNQQGNPPRVGMFRELLAIHAHLRRDLATVRRLAEAVRAGITPAEIVDEIRDLETNSPLWRLKFGCMHYCRFVHLHHTLEDTALFPLVRKRDPSLHRVVDRLEADHRAVHAITERIAAEARMLDDDLSGSRRERLAGALLELEEHLLGHLAFEEASLGPLLSTWREWPVE